MSVRPKRIDIIVGKLSIFFHLIPLRIIPHALSLGIHSLLREVAAFLQSNDCFFVQLKLVDRHLKVCLDDRGGRDASLAELLDQFISDLCRANPAIGVGELYIRAIILKYYKKTNRYGEEKYKNLILYQYL